MDTLEFFVPSFKKDKRGRPAPLDGLNDLVRSERTSRGYGNSLKRRNGRHAERACLEQMRRQGWKTPDRKCRVTLTFVEIDHRRDPDNIMGGAKFILDGLIKRRGMRSYGAGAIVDDSQKWIELEFGKFEYDRERPGCKVRIEVIGD